ncbi:MAG: sugar transferase [Clostridia bacterium]|nr:sugar transferase [Clostridia bacterium]
MYEKYIKRILDFALSLVALCGLLPLMLILTVVGAIVMKGNPFFVQPRPGMIDKKTGKEKIFKLIKFRTMNNKKDKNGKLLPDKVRLNGYGRFLRSTSLDELPELWNILLGNMAFVGPRPQLVRDMVFMTPEQRRRHSVMPGLTGLAQINGRNNISWERKFQFDLEYIDSGITFAKDFKIVFQTVSKVFTREDTVREGTVSDLDFGDYLLEKGEVTEQEYNILQKEAKQLLEV